MKFPKQALLNLFMVLTTIAPRAHGQTKEIINLFRDLETASTVTQETFDKADPVLAQLVQSSKENVVAALPLILHAASDPHLPVRRVAAMALYDITTRPDGQALLSKEVATFTALLADPDIPIRRVSSLAIYTLRLDTNSPLVPVLGTYLTRQDAVVTIGTGVATLLMQVAPDDAKSTNAVVPYMRRQDQTAASRGDLLNAIMHVARSHSREIGKEVAAYAADPDEQTSVHAIETLQSMGKNVVLDNQHTLSRLARDNSKAQSVRDAATKTLATVP